MSSTNPWEIILSILQSHDGAETAKALVKEAMKRGLNRRRFFRHLKKLADEGKVRASLLSDGDTHLMAYETVDHGKRGVFNFVYELLEDRLVDYMDNWDRDLPKEVRTSKLVLALGYAWLIDETAEELFRRNHGHSEWN